MTTDLVFGPRIPLYRCVHTARCDSWIGELVPCGAEIRYDGHGTGWHHASPSPYHIPKHHAVAPPGAHPDLPPPEE